MCGQVKIRLCSSTHDSQRLHTWKIIVEKTGHVRRDALTMPLKTILERICRWLYLTLVGQGVKEVKQINPPPGKVGLQEFKSGSDNRG